MSEKHHMTLDSPQALLGGASECMAATNGAYSLCAGHSKIHPLDVELRLWEIRMLLLLKYNHRNRNVQLYQTTINTGMSQNG